jgi:hypothetical protein
VTDSLRSPEHTPSDAGDLLALWMSPDPDARQLAVIRMLKVFYPDDLLDGVDLHRAYWTMTGLLDLAGGLAIRLAEERGATPDEVDNAAFDIVRELIAERPDDDLGSSPTRGGPG